MKIEHSSKALAWVVALLLVSFCTSLVAEAADQLTVHAMRQRPQRAKEPAWGAVLLYFTHLVFPANLAENATLTVDGR